MKVLVACEESQEVCKAFRARGHEAYSCDLQECSGGHPEWHIKGDCLPLLNGHCEIVTCGGGQNRNRQMGYDHCPPALHKDKQRRGETPLERP